MAVNCSHCGADNPPGALFCIRCGAEMASDQMRTPRQDSAGQATSNRAKTDAPSAGAGHDEPSIEQILEAAERSDPVVDSTSGADDPQPVSEAQQPTVLPAAPPPVPPPVQFPTESILPAGQSFLEPVVVSGELVRDLLDAVGVSPSSRLNPDRQREVRLLMTGDSEMATSPPFPVQRPLSLRSAWVFALLALAVIVPLVFGWVQPAGQVQQWPGVESAYTAIASLPPASTILVNWAYDPASAGELDMVALPAISQLLEGGHQSLLFTTQPAGIGAAQRLYARASTGLASQSGKQSLSRPRASIFLSGGAAALPLVGLDLQQVFAPSLGEVAPSMNVAPALVLVLAAQADDVQQWLELAQPLDHLPVVALTAASAELLLEPYLDSGQLTGLVSGFDGAVAYQALRSTPLAIADEQTLQRQVVAQNWGQFALLAVILIGNLAALLGRGRSA